MPGHAVPLGAAGKLGTKVDDVGKAAGRLGHAGSLGKGEKALGILEQAIPPKGVSEAAAKKHLSDLSGAGYSVKGPTKVEGTDLFRAEATIDSVVDVEKMTDGLLVKVGSDGQEYRVVGKDADGKKIIIDKDGLRVPPEKLDALALQPVYVKKQVNQKVVRGVSDPAEIRKIIQGDCKECEIISFGGFSGQGYKDPAQMVAAFDKFIAGPPPKDPSKVIISAGGTPEGIGAIYSRAKEKGFRTAGVVSEEALKYGDNGIKQSYNVDVMVYVPDSSWGGVRQLPEPKGGFPKDPDPEIQAAYDAERKVKEAAHERAMQEQLSNGTAQQALDALAPTSRAYVESADQVVFLGGGDVGAAELTASLNSKGADKTHFIGLDNGAGTRGSAEQKWRELGQQVIDPPNVPAPSRVVPQAVVREFQDETTRHLAEGSLRRVWAADDPVLRSQDRTLRSVREELGSFRRNVEAEITSVRAQKDMTGPGWDDWKGATTSTAKADGGVSVSTSSSRAKAYGLEDYPETITATPVGNSNQVRIDVQFSDRSESFMAPADQITFSQDPRDSLTGVISTVSRYYKNEQAAIRAKRLKNLEALKKEIELMDPSDSIGMSERSRAIEDLLDFELYPVD